MSTKGYYETDIVKAQIEKNAHFEDSPPLHIITARAIVESFLDEVPKKGELTGAEMRDQAMANSFRTIQEHTIDEFVLDQARAMIALHISSQVWLQKDYVELAGDTFGSSETDHLTWVASTWDDVATTLLSQQK
jgi:hypothetical protein